MKSAIDLLSKFRDTCHACAGHCGGIEHAQPTAEGIANQLRAHGVDPDTLRPGTREQIAQWRKDIGFVLVMEEEDGKWKIAEDQRRVFGNGSSGRGGTPLVRRSALLGGG